MVKGSYRFETIQGNESELGRLEAQARIVASIEKRILAEAGIASANRIIELGCGPGFVTRLIRELNPQGTVLGVDYSVTLLQQYRQGPGRENPGAVYAVAADAKRMPVRANWAEFVYARFLLQHVPQGGELLAEQLGLLAPGGTLCVVDSDDSLVLHYPPVPAIASLMERSRERQAACGGDRFIGEKLPALLSDQGFEEIESRVVYLTHSQISFEVLANIAFGYKARLLGLEHTLAEIVSGLEEQARAGRLFLGTGVVVCTARKPA